MYKQFKNFIVNNLIKIDDPKMYFREDEIIYGIKNITDEIRHKYELYKKQNNNSVWKIETFSLFSTWEGLNEKQIQEVKNNITHPTNLPIPQQYIDFLKNFNGLNANLFSIFGHNGYGNGPTSLYFKRMTQFPQYINKDNLNIGRYGCDDSPIFINNQGNIFVYSGTHMYDKKNPGLPNELNKALIGYWNSLEEFLTDEITRYYNLCINKFFRFPTVDMLPNNITPEILNKLQFEKK